MNTSILSGHYDFNSDKLDLGQVLKKLTAKLRFTQNKKILLSPPESKTLSEINSIYNILKNLEQNDNWNSPLYNELSTIHPDFLFDKVQIKLSKYQALDLTEIINTYFTLKAYGKLVNKFQFKTNANFEIQKFNKEFKSFLREAPLLFDEKTQEPVYYKHPELSPIDKEIKNLTKEIRTQLQRTSQEWNKREILQTESYDIVEDRYLLSVRSDRYSSNLGKIVYRSNSGNTLYVEPNSLRDLANQKIEKEALLDRKLYQILKSLTSVLSENISSIKDAFLYIKDLDLYITRIWASHTYGLTTPELTTDKSQIQIKELHHPLLDDPVTNNFLPKIPFKGLLISGPNTGGKTVLMKSICLSLILPHLGFGVPAKFAKIPISNTIQFLSHDNQNLLEGLSSFSSEAITYLETTNNAKEGDFVFIDEIFNSTSSYEASELAFALVENLNDRGVIVFISSHHEKLKQDIFNRELILSAHMGFHGEDKRPTYQIYLGTPGHSYAKEVFKKLEAKILKSDEITYRIKKSKTQIGSIEDKLSALESLEIENRELNEQIKEARKNLERKEKALYGSLELEKEKLQEDFDRKWNKLKKETFDLTEKIKKGEVRNIVKVSQGLNRISEAQDKKSKISDQPKKQKADPSYRPQIGDSVHIISLHKKGTILNLNLSRKKAQVSCNKVKMWITFNDISFTKEQRKKESKQHTFSIQKNTGLTSMKLDARGLRRDEFLSKAERHILDVINGDLPFVDIVHGHGDGILRKSLYELLNRYKDDLQYDFIEGNLGTTRIELLNS